MCSTPVTFGGGITIEYACALVSPDGWKHPASSQALYSRGSAPAGSNLWSSMCLFQSGKGKKKKRAGEGAPFPISSLGNEASAPCGRCAVLQPLLSLQRSWPGWRREIGRAHV